MGHSVIFLRRSMTGSSSTAIRQLRLMATAASSLILCPPTGQQDAVITDDSLDSAIQTETKIFDDVYGKYATYVYAPTLSPLGLTLDDWRYAENGGTSGPPSFAAGIDRCVECGGGLRDRSSKKRISTGSTIAGAQRTLLDDAREKHVGGDAGATAIFLAERSSTSRALKGGSSYSPNHAWRSTLRLFDAPSNYASTGTYLPRQLPRRDPPYPPPLLLGASRN